MKNEADRQLDLNDLSQRPRKQQSAAASPDPIADLEATRRKTDAAVKALRKVKQLEKQAAKDATKLRAAIKAARKALEVPLAGKSTDAIAWLNQVDRDLIQAESAASKRFATDLDAVLSKSGSRIGGHSPRLTWWFFTIEVGDGAARIWYGPQIEEIKKTKLVAASVADVLLAARQKLEADGLDEQAFLDQLYESYLASRGPAVHPPPVHVPIAKVYMQLLVRRQPRTFFDDPFRRNLLPYPGMQFSFDLYRLKNRGRGEEQLHLEAASRSLTRKKADSIWVPNDSSDKGVRYSHLYFRRRN